MFFVQPIQNMCNASIGNVRHEQQICSMTSIERLDAHGRGVGDVEFVVVIFKGRHVDNKLSK
jgi:hypothetical protein